MHEKYDDVLPPGLRRVVAPNPSPLTFNGTNTWLIGEGRVAVIDPGPDDPRHLAAILGTLRPGERVSHIFLTHAHLDHSALARPLAEATGAPVLAFGDAKAGRSDVMERLAAAGLAGGEGVDASFQPDETLADGTVVDDGDWALEAVHTPGHFGNHVSFLWGGAAFSGDHVMGWSTSLVSPPDGDMGAYMASLARLAARAPARLYPGHGEPVADGPARISELVRHRRQREAAILAALGNAPADAATLARAIYTDIPAALMPAATRNVLAHLIDMDDKCVIEALDPISSGTRFRTRPAARDVSADSPLDGSRSPLL